MLPHISRILRSAHNLWTSEFREGNSARETQAGEREKWVGTKKPKECEPAILILLCFADAGTNFAKLPTNRAVSGARVLSSAVPPRLGYVQQREIARGGRDREWRDDAVIRGIKR